MIVSLIVAMDRRGGIGLENRLPWHLPADLKRFKQLTMGHHLIVGRKTWNSIGRVLPGRTMVVLTRDPNFKAEGVAVVHSLKDAVALAQENGDNEAFIGGGAQVYAQALEQADRIYLTLVDGEFEVDTFFPQLIRDEWVEQSAESFGSDDRNAHSFTFKVLERNPAIAKKR